MYSLHSFSDRADMVQALADDITARLNQDIESKGKALWLVSGGSTPKPLFEEMAMRDLNWAKIVIALVDERFVPEGHPRSNTSFVKNTLLQNKAQAATFAEMMGEGSLSEAAKAADVRYKAIGIAPSSLLLGLGPDGHTASLFPGAEGLETAIAPDAPEWVAPLTAIQSDVTGDEVERLTATGALIRAANHVVLMSAGQAKREAFESALADTEARLPILRVSENLAKPLRFYWAP